MTQINEMLKRYQKFKEYERTRYMSDKPENREIVIRGCIKLLREEIEPAWRQLSESEKQKCIPLL